MHHCTGLQVSSGTQQLIHGLPPPTPPITVGSSVVQALNAVEHIEEVSSVNDKDATVGRKIVVVGEDEDEAGNTSDEGYRTHSSGMHVQGDILTHSIFDHFMLIHRQVSKGKADPKTFSR